jgi:hypothetical protein
MSAAVTRCFGRRAIPAWPWPLPARRSSRPPTDHERRSARGIALSRQVVLARDTRAPLACTWTSTRHETPAHRSCTRSCGTTSRCFAASQPGFGAATGCRACPDEFRRVPAVRVLLADLQRVSPIGLWRHVRSCRLISRHSRRRKRERHGTLRHELARRRLTEASTMRTAVVSSRSSRADTRLCYLRRNKAMPAREGRGPDRHSDGFKRHAFRFSRDSGDGLALTRCS